MAIEQLLESLDRDGYAVVTRVVQKEIVDELRRWIDTRVDEDVERRMEDANRRREAGEADARAFPLGSEGHISLELSDDSRIVALIKSVTEIARAIGTPFGRGRRIEVTLPGWGGHEGLYQDLPGPAPEIGRWDGVIFTFPLSTWDGMRLVPGSHRRDPVFREAYAGAIAPHRDEVYVDAGPGDVVINSIHVWKSATLNRSTERRSEIWLSYDDGEKTASKVREYWAHAEIRHGDAPISSPG